MACTANLAKLLKPSWNLSETSPCTQYSDASSFVILPTVMAHSSDEIKEQASCIPLMLIFPELTGLPGDGLSYLRGRASLLRAVRYSPDHSRSNSSRRPLWVTQGSSSLRSIYSIPAFLRVGVGWRRKTKAYRPRCLHLHQIDTLRKRAD